MADMHNMNDAVDKAISLTLTDYQEEYERFMKFYGTLCDKAKEIFFNGMFSVIPNGISKLWEFDDKLSPIEQMFFIAYQFLVVNICGSIRWKGKYMDKEKESFLSAELSKLFPQYDLEVDGKKYILDFFIDFAPLFDNTAVMYAIELDGHDYHSNKKQMSKDYARERALQKSGIKVIRFTGSQVYSNPFYCAREAIDIILSDSAQYIEFIG